MRNLPKFTLMLAYLFFIGVVQSQENSIVPRHQDLPQWSPDGAKYACVETGLNAGVLESQIRIYQVSGGAETQVAASLFGLGELAEKALPEGSVDDAPVVAFFSWAPDSEHYVFTSSTPIGYDLFIGNLSGDVYPFTLNDLEADLFPRWSPNRDESRQYIAYMREGKISLQKVKKEGGIFKRDGAIVPILPPACVEALLPEWSPDGTKLAFSALTESDNYDIYVYEIGATDQTYSRLTQTLYIHEYRPVWSPDGEWIAVYNKNTDEDDFGISILKAGIEQAVTNQIRPDGRYFQLSHFEFLLADRVHHSKILGPAWMPSGRHLLYVRSADSTIMIAELSLGHSLERGVREVDVRRWPVEGISTQLNADVQCAPVGAKHSENSSPLLIFSQYTPAGGGVAYRNLKLRPLETETKKFTISVLSNDREWPLRETDEIRFSAPPIHKRSRVGNRRLLSWEMEHAVGDVLKGIVECRGYNPQQITLPILQQKSIEAQVLFGLPEVEIGMRLVDLEGKGLEGIEVAINSDPLGKTKKLGYIRGKSKLRITHPIESTQFPYKISSTDGGNRLTDLSAWGIKSLKIGPSHNRQIHYELEIHQPEVNEGAVRKLDIVVALPVQDRPVSLQLPVQIKNELGQPIPPQFVSFLLDERSLALLEGRVLIQASYDKPYQLEAHIKAENTSSVQPPPLAGTFQLHPGPSNSDNSPSWTITPDSQTGLTKQSSQHEDTLSVQFQTGALTTQLECLYPDEIPIVGRTVMYRERVIGTTNSEGKIEPALLLGADETEGFVVNVDGSKYPLKFTSQVEVSDENSGASGINTRLRLSLDAQPRVTLYMEDANSAETEYVVKIKTSFGNQSGQRVVKYLLKKGEVGKWEALTIPRLPGDAFTLFLSKGTDQAEVQMKIRGDGGIEVVKDPRGITRIGRGKRFVVKPSKIWQNE